MVQTKNGDVKLEGYICHACKRVVRLVEMVEDNPLDPEPDIPF